MQWLHSLGGHSSCQALKETTLCIGLVKITQSQSANRMSPKQLQKVLFLPKICLARDTWWVSKAICMDGSQAMPRQTVFARFLPVANLDEVTWPWRAYPRTLHARFQSLLPPLLSMLTPCTQGEAKSVLDWSCVDWYKVASKTICLSRKYLMGTT